MMGDAMFPGASDNASGTAMVLNLAKYYSKRNNEYSIVFILFAGEEAGLIGSDYFTSFPTFNIQKIKMLINLDIMGSAEGGVVTVNATEFPRQFATLQKINRKKGYLPEVRKRGPTKNSDHYHFYKKGIPSFFIYSIGGPGFYHDVYDKAESIPMTNYENVFKLLVDFVSTF
jgi:Zn-dependent M28 family amino/carboxypeptidase